MFTELHGASKQESKLQWWNEHFNTAMLRAQTTMLPSQGHLNNFHMVEIMGAALIECHLCSFRFQKPNSSQNLTKMYKKCGGIKAFWTEM